MRTMKNETSLYANCVDRRVTEPSAGEHHVTYLLSEADARARVEWDENEGIPSEVLDPVIKEAVGVKFQR